VASVIYESVRGVAVLTIDNPPVNAASHAVRAGLIKALDAAHRDPEVRAVVVIGAGKTFVAGADIRELGAPMRTPLLADVQRAIEAATKPVVAALHGSALGGGLELALACHYRIALKSVALGLPEIHLGIIPGAGATQRLPRLIGAEAALDIILGGTPISGTEGLRLGVLDALAQGDTPRHLSDEAVDFALSRADGELIRARDRRDRIADTDPALFHAVREKNRQRWHGQEAPLRAVDCVRAATENTFEEGLRLETEACSFLLGTPQAKALRYAFFAQRLAAKVPGLDNIEPAPIASAAVIGAGTMGAGIAHCFIDAGIPVCLVDQSETPLKQALERIRAHYGRLVERGRLSRERADRALALITPGTTYEAITGADIVVEAAFEDLAIKREIFSRLDRLAKPGAVLATNTSALDIDQIAAATQRPERVIGTHFFSPAHRMKLQENVRGKNTSERTVATAMELARRLGKVAVLAGNCDGFIGNRIAGVYGRECDFLLEEGATPWQIDNALKAFGFPLGIYLMRDMAGLDVGWRMRRNRDADRDKSLRYSVIADRIYAMGRLGQKNGAGYYTYEGRAARPDPAIETLITAVSEQAGIVRRAIGDEEIVTRVLAAMVNEGARIVGEGIAIRASDVDITYLFGYGFPRHRGGPMYWAQQQGLQRVLAIVERYHREQGTLWSPAPLLVERASTGTWDDSNLWRAAT